MIKVKDGYAKLIGTTALGTANRVLLSNGGDFGLHTGRNNEADKIVRTDASGYILAGWINTTSGDMGTTDINRIYCSNDGFIRYKTPANFFSTLANDSNLLSITVGSLNRKLIVAYASNADTLDGYHADDILPYGLENLCVGAVASRGNTTLNSDGSITTSGINSDTYFFVRCTENLIAGLIYTVGFYVTGVPSGNTTIWSFRFASQANNNLIVPIKSNGWCWGTGTIPEDIAADKNIIFDDWDRGFYNSINISKFVIVKGRQRAYYTPPISKMSVNYATSAGNAATATKWAAARTITLTGSVTGSVLIDGSENITLATTTNHTHSFDSLTSKPTTLSGYGITNALEKKLIKYKNDYEKYVILLCKIGTLSTITSHTINGTFWTYLQGATRYQAAYINVHCSDWSTDHNEYYGFTPFGLGYKCRLVTCTYQSAQYLAITFENVQACIICFDGSYSNILFTPILYLTGTSGTIENSEIYNSITDVTYIKTPLISSAEIAITSSNFNSYTPTLTGTGAIGTWNINVTGNAATATDADTVDGYHATCGNDKPWGTIPVITVSGWMDVGKQLEFHYDNTTGSDYSTVLKCTGNHSNVVSLPSASGTLALTSQIPTSLPASDVYDWAKQPTKPLYSFSEITPGVATIGDGTNRLMFRTNAGYMSGMYHSTPGHESMVFANISPGTSWIFANTNPTANTDWTTLTPSLQIKNGTVTINKLIPSGTNAPYNLDVNGSANATTLYENGVRVSVSGHTHNYLPLSGGTMNQGSHVVFPGTSTDASYGGSIEFREVNYVNTTQTDWLYAPGITFHWGGRSVGKLGLRSDGDLAWRDLSIIHSGNISSQSVNYANSAGYTKRLYANSISSLTTHPGDYSLAYSRFQAGVSNIFPTINNANGVITAHLHYGDYFAQIGLSSDGRMYYRTMMDLTLDAGVTWNKVAWTTDIPTKVSQLTNDSGFITGGPYLPLTGGTLSGNLTVGLKDANRIISIAGNTSHLKMVAHTNATYIESGNKDWDGNTPLLITGYSGNKGSNLYLYFANIYCRNNSYVNLDSGNWSSYITIPTLTSQLTNDSGFLTSRGYIGRTAVLATAAALSLTGIGNITPETASTYYLGASDKPWYLIFCKYFTSDLVSLSSSSNSGSLAYSSTSGYFYITANNIAANTSGGFVMKTVKNGVLSLIVLESASNYGQIKTTGDLYIGGRVSNTTALISSDAAHNMYISVQGKALLVCDSSENSIRRGKNLADNITLGTASCPWKSLYVKNDVKLKGKTNYFSILAPNGTHSSDEIFSLPYTGGTLVTTNSPAMVKGWATYSFSYTNGASSTYTMTFKAGGGVNIVDSPSYYEYNNYTGILIRITSNCKDTSGGTIKDSLMVWGLASDAKLSLYITKTTVLVSGSTVHYYLVYCTNTSGTALTSGSGTLNFIYF